MPKNKDSLRKEITPSVPENEDKGRLDEILENIDRPLNKEQKEQIEKFFDLYRSQSFSISKMRSAPLPHPSEFEQYERVLPGSADRILTMAENQSKHRQGIEKKIISSDSFVQNVGVIFAFVLALAAMVGSMLLIYVGKDIVGLVSIIATLSSLVGVFIFGKSKQKKQLEHKKNSNR